MKKMTTGKNGGYTHAALCRSAGDATLAKVKGGGRSYTVKSGKETRMTHSKGNKVRR